MKIKCLNDIFVGLGKFCRKNSSKLLTGATIAGIVTTAVVSTRQGSKLEQKRAEAEAKGEKLSKKEVVKTVAPTIIVTGATVGCAVGLFVTNRKREAALTSALGMAVTRFSRFQRKVDEHDPTLKRTIEKEMMEEDVEEAKKKAKSDKKFTSIGGKDVIFTHIKEGEPVLCYDVLSNKYFYSSIADLRNAMYELNRQFQSDKFICVNDYFAHFGLPEEEYGWGIGWQHSYEYDSGHQWIDVDLDKEVLADGLEVVRVEVMTGPYDPDTGIFAMTGFDETQPNYFQVR
jgi:regulator of RNase E activity RraB